MSTSFMWSSWSIINDQWSMIHHHDHHHHQNDHHHHHHHQNNHHPTRYSRTILLTHPTPQNILQPTPGRKKSILPSRSCTFSLELSPKKTRIFVTPKLLALENASPFQYISIFDYFCGIYHKFQGGEYLSKSHTISHHPSIRTSVFPITCLTFPGKLRHQQRVPYRNPCVDPNSKIVDPTDFLAPGACRRAVGSLGQWRSTWGPPIKWPKITGSRGL